MRSVAVDIETLSTSKRALILSIGACAFDEDGFKKNINLCNPVAWYGQVPWRDPTQEDRHVSQSTLEWWAGEPGAQRVLQAPDSEQKKYVYPGIRELLTGYAQFVTEELKGGFIISQGTDFDIAILDSAFEDFGLEALKTWKFWIALDERTYATTAQRAGISKIGTTLYVGEKQKFMKHHAADDAMQMAAKHCWYSHELWKLSQKTSQGNLKFIS